MLASGFYSDSGVCGGKARPSGKENVKFTPSYIRGGCEFYLEGLDWYTTNLET